MTHAMLCLSLILLGEEQPFVRESKRIRSQILAVDSRLNDLTDHLDNQQGSSQRLSDEVNRLELRRELLTTTIQKHELQLLEASQQLQLNQTRRAELVLASKEQERRISFRLRQLYKRGTLGHSQILLKQERLAELINAYHYAKVLTRRDHQALAAYSQLISRLQVVNMNLQEIRAAAERTRADLASQEKALQDLLTTRSNRLIAIRRQADKNIQLLNELELEKEEMIMVVRRLLAKDADPLALRVPMARYKGALSWPAKGKLMRKFGVYRDPEFKTRQRQNGFDLALPLDSPVSTVYSGRVIYADWFRSYGNVVIVDHGSKLVSFYGHLKEILVQSGDLVMRDAVIARSGDSGSLDGPRLHFEIRNKTEPEDPQLWLNSR